MILRAENPGHRVGHDEYPNIAHKGVPCRRIASDRCKDADDNDTIAPEAALHHFKVIDVGPLKLRADLRGLTLRAPFPARARGSSADEPKANEETEAP
jgi:hypothetical protein